MHWQQPPRPILLITESISVCPQKLDLFDAGNNFRLTYHVGPAYCRPQRDSNSNSQSRRHVHWRRPPRPILLITESISVCPQKLDLFDAGNNFRLTYQVGPAYCRPQQDSNSNHQSIRQASWRPPPWPILFIKESLSVCPQKLDCFDEGKNYRLAYQVGPAYCWHNSSHLKRRLARLKR